MSYRDRGDRYEPRSRPRSRSPDRRDSDRGGDRGYRGGDRRDDPDGGDRGRYEARREGGDRFDSRSYERGGDRGRYDDRRRDGDRGDGDRGRYDARDSGSGGGKTQLQQLAERESLAPPASHGSTHYPRYPDAGAMGGGGLQGIGAEILPSIQPRAGAAPGANVASSDDWKCPSCNNWNWGKRKTCNICNASRSGLSAVKGTDSGTTRSGFGGGFKEVDEEEEARRRRREEEARSERDQRKAERKKCAFCNRFSCIC